MTVCWTLDEVAAVVGGTVVGDGEREVRGIATDSRTLAPGELFVAISGERYDGHEFVEDAFGAGAGAVLVSTASTDAAPRVEVADPLTALRDLAVAHRTTIDARVVAVTGSTGKTTTKDLLEASLPSVWASPLSYNNEIGVPLTVLGTPEGTRHLVVEVGSRNVGDIRWLTPAVRPDVAVITNLGVVHLETFGSRERLAEAKWELIEALEPGGTAVLPVCEPLLSRDHEFKTISFGVDVDADVVASDVVLDDAALPTFRLSALSHSVTVKLPLPGRHQAHNAAAAIAAGLALDIDLDDLVEGIALVEGSPWRMEIHTGSYTVVNDAYNANPDSVEAALRTVAELPGRHIAVLGRMAELGHVAEAEHVRIGTLASSLGFASVVVVGEEPGIARGAGQIAVRVEDAEEAGRLLADDLRAGDVVLVKASRTVGLEKLALRLTEEAPA